MLLDHPHHGPPLQLVRLPRHPENSNEGNNLNTACYSNASSSEIVAGGTNIFGGSQPDLLCINAGSGTILRRVSIAAA